MEKIRDTVTNFIQNFSLMPQQEQLRWVVLGNENY